MSSLFVIQGVLALTFLGMVLPLEWEGETKYRGQSDVRCASSGAGAGAVGVLPPEPL